MKALAGACMLAAIACAADTPPGQADDDDVGADAGPTDDDVIPPFTNGVSTLAGTATASMVDGERAVVRFANPTGVAVRADGAVYVTDFANQRVRFVETDGTTSTLTLQNGFKRPFGIVLDNDSGRLFVQTDDNPEGQHSNATGTIWEINVDTGVATDIIADIGRPRGLAVLPDGRLVLADMTQHVVRVLDPSSGELTNLAGTIGQAGYVDGAGAAARFDTPYGVAVRDGVIIVADKGNNRLRAVTLAGQVTTLAGSGVAGNGDGAAAVATFDGPQDVAVTADGTIYVADLRNYVIRAISAAGEVSTVVGSGVAGYRDDDNLLAAQLYGLEGIDVTADGSKLVIADGSRGDPVPYNRVRVVNMP